VQYTLALPSTIEGAVTMAIPDFENTRTMFAVHGTSSLEESESDELAYQEFDTLDSLYELYQPYLKNIAAYQPMYFLVGTNPEKSKFQFSFKYRFFNPESTLGKKYPWVKGFHLAYTQTSFWDLKSESKPFEDTSYKPEFFFLSPNIGVPWARGFFVKGGFQHESNGRGGEDSRSTNFLYIKPIYIAYDKNTKLGIMIAPKIWAYVSNEDETNPDLKYYRGYFDLETKLGKADSFVLGSHFRWAKEGGSIELDLTYPLHRFIFKNLNLYFQAQYVNALAESLLNYRDRTEALRLGFAIVR
jgi:outer membrane phospholipase A